MTNHRFNVFVKCLSNAFVACVPHTQTLVSRYNSLDCEITIIIIMARGKCQLNEHDVLACVQYEPAHL